MGTMQVPTRRVQMVRSDSGLIIPDAGETVVVTHQVTLVHLLAATATRGIGAQLGIFAAWNMMGQPIPVSPSQAVQPRRTLSLV